MAKVPVSIQSPVGIRYGWAVQTNLPDDTRKIAALFDRIPFHQGGTREVANQWPADQDTLIEKLAEQITWFQKKNNRPLVDGVVDPGQGTLKLMNELALDGPAGSSTPQPSSGLALPATVVPPMGTYNLEGGNPKLVADPTSVAGAGPLRPLSAPQHIWRRLVKVEGSSITWFGITASKHITDFNSAVPHLNFHPTPWQGGYHDPGYDSFATWIKLWADYTANIGTQIAAASVDQIGVFPFYRNTQPANLGSFAQNWKDAVASAITAAVRDALPGSLPSPYTFTEIESSSFSNGWLIHYNFHRNAQGASQATRQLYELDGHAAQCLWVSPKGLHYRNKPAPKGQNPEGNIFYVGQRWDLFEPHGGGNKYGHQNCRDYLLYHGLVLKSS
ncbi:MAG: hypothetical protein NW208_06290 [Bryobacter sp.]|nr:hypothetical protein [Bryobacter sp.]